MFWALVQLPDDTPLGPRFATGKGGGDGVRKRAEVRDVAKSWTRLGLFAVSPSFVVVSGIAVEPSPETARLVQSVERND
jgi:hypothetical protein